LVQEQTQDPQQKLKKLYNYALTRPCGHTVEYQGYTLEKVEWSHPEHDEYTVKNRDGNTVESYTITAFDSPEALKQRLDQLIQKNPDNVQEAIKG
jgi:hypothetical protein